MAGPAGTEPTRAEVRRGNRLLWMAAAAFAVLLAGWITFIVLAHRHPVATVPVAPRMGAQTRP